MFKHMTMEIAQLKRIIEAAIMAASAPQTLVQLNDLFGEDSPPGVDGIHAAIELLQSDYADRGVQLVEVASGWRFQVHQDVQPWVGRLWTERQPKYTRALLETLALIAYRQPVTRAEIEQIRGVAVSSNIVKTLEEREWIRVLGHRDVPGKPALFGTTRQFLDYFGLKSLDQLPPLAELRDLSELEPQLDLDRIHPAALAGRLAVDADDTQDAESAADDTLIDADLRDLDPPAHAAGRAIHESIEATVDDDDGDAFAGEDHSLDSVETVIASDQPAHDSIEANVADGPDAATATEETP